MEAKRALPRPERETRETNISVKKLFVGGLKDNHDEECLRDYFTQFGNVVSVKLLTDKTTGKRRGFAFIEFDDYDAVDKAIRKCRLLQLNEVLINRFLAQQFIVSTLSNTCSSTLRSLYIIWRKRTECPRQSLPMAIKCNNRCSRRLRATCLRLVTVPQCLRHSKCRHISISNRHHQCRHRHQTTTTGDHHLPCSHIITNPRRRK